MSRLTDHLEATKGHERKPADPLPSSKSNGDSGDAEIWDHDDNPPGVDRRTGEDHRSDAEREAWAHLEAKYGDEIPYDQVKAWERGEFA